MAIAPFSSRDAVGRQVTRAGVPDGAWSAGQPTHTDNGAIRTYSPPVSPESGITINGTKYRRELHHWEYEYDGTCPDADNRINISGETVTVDNSQAEYDTSYYQSGSLTIIAYMRLVEWSSPLPPGYFSVAVQADPNAGGTVTGSGSYQYGALCTITAIANNYYTFVNWTSSAGETVATATHEFYVTDDVVWTAHFSGPTHYTVTVEAAPAAGGTVEIDGEEVGSKAVARGTSCTITATPNPGYEFDGWRDDYGTIINDNPRTFAVTRNIGFTARFARLVQVDVAADPDKGGIVSGGTGGVAVKEGTRVTIVAEPNDGWTFKEWTSDSPGWGPETSPRYSFNALTSMTCTAKFLRPGGMPGETVTVATRVNPAGGGLAHGGGIYTPGTLVTLRAEEISGGRKFSRWTSDRGQSRTEKEFSFRCGVDVIWTAHFTASSTACVITVVADPAAGGTVTGGGRYNAGAYCTISAVANSGYKFVKWSCPNKEDVVTETHEFYVRRSETWTAHFVVASELSGNTRIRVFGQTGKPFRFELPNGDGSQVHAGCPTYLSRDCSAGDVIQLSATITGTAANYWKFVKWIEPSGREVGESEYSFDNLTEEYIEAYAVRNGNYDDLVWVVCFEPIVKYALDFRVRGRIEASSYLMYNDPTYPFSKEFVQNMFVECAELPVGEVISSGYVIRFGLPVYAHLDLWADSLVDFTVDEDYEGRCQITMAEIVAGVVTGIRQVTSPTYYNTRDIVYEAMGAGGDVGNGFMPAMPVVIDIWYNSIRLGELLCTSAGRMLFDDSGYIVRDGKPMYVGYNEREGRP